MRLAFEAKLNNLHAQYRELESKFAVLTKELQIHSERNTENQTTINRIKNENRTLSHEKLDLNTKLRTQIEQNKSLREEGECFELKIDNLQHRFESLQKKFNNQRLLTEEKQISLMKSQKEMEIQLKKYD
jgi:hypothetical protein